MLYIEIAYIHNLFFKCYCPMLIDCCHSKNLKLKVIYQQKLLMVYFDIDYVV